MYLLKLVRPGGAEEYSPECVRIFKTPLAQAGDWRLELEVPGRKDPLFFTVPSDNIETIYIMTKHGDTIEILGKIPNATATAGARRRRRHRRNS